MEIKLVSGDKIFDLQYYKQDIELKKHRGKRAFGIYLDDCA